MISKSSLCKHVVFHSRVYRGYAKNRNPYLPLSDFNQTCRVNNHDSKLTIVNGTILDFISDMSKQCMVSNNRCQSDDIILLNYNLFMPILVQLPKCFFHHEEDLLSFQKRYSFLCKCKYSSCTEFSSKPHPYYLVFTLNANYKSGALILTGCQDPNYCIYSGGLSLQE